MTHLSIWTRFQNFKHLKIVKTSRKKTFDRSCGKQDGKREEGAPVAANGRKKRTMKVGWRQ